MLPGVKTGPSPLLEPERDWVADQLQQVGKALRLAFSTVALRFVEGH